MITGHPILDRAPEEYETPVYIFEKYAISAYPREERGFSHGRLE
jgi:hypothetical protein